MGRLSPPPQFEPYWLLIPFTRKGTLAPGKSVPHGCPSWARCRGEAGFALHLQPWEEGIVDSEGWKGPHRVQPAAQSRASPSYIISAKAL